MAWTTPATWVSGDGTATQFNAQIRDNLLAIGGAASSYTPTISQGASTNIAKSVTEASYLSIGKLGFLWVRLALTAAGTAGSGITVSTPWTMAIASNVILGTGIFYDASTVTMYTGTAIAVSTTTISITPDGAGSGGAAGLFPNVALASGDIFGFAVQARLA